MCNYELSGISVSHTMQYLSRNNVLLVYRVINMWDATYNETNTSMCNTIAVTNVCLKSEVSSRMTGSSSH